jgi:PAS domain S-box-containing protein
VLVIMLICAVALLLTTGAALTYEMFSYRRAIVRDLMTQADIIGANSSVALAFRDPKAAREILSALHARPEIVYTCLYDNDGKVFATYTPSPPEKALVPNHPEADGHRFEAQHLLLFRQVNLGPDKVGTIFLKASLREQYARLRSYAGILLIVMLASLVVALFLSAWLQRIISAPIRSLANVTRSVTEQRDYSLRAPKQSNDEIGVLTDGFNEMLAQVQTRDEALRKSEQQLKAVLDNSTAFIYLKDREGRYLIVNRRFESLLPGGKLDLIGKTDLELFPRNYAEVWWANDRKVLAEGRAMEFEERAPLADGPHEFISFKSPLFDASGRPYALCGISTDITERKRLEKQILEISDREQRRIGYDLHDGLCQHLAATGYAASLLDEKLSEKSLKESANAREIAELISEAIGQARALSRVLYPVRLQADGLVCALQELVFNTENLWGIACRFEGDESVAIEDVPAATHLYRIAQEAVANAVKHAKARQITVRLTASNSSVTLVVSDDGKGIPDPSRRGRGMGLHIMQYRARLIGGTVEIHGTPGGGTTLTCTYISGNEVSSSSESVNEVIDSENQKARL